MYMTVDRVMVGRCLCKGVIAKPRKFSCVTNGLGFRPSSQPCVASEVPHPANDLPRWHSSVTGGHTEMHTHNDEFDETPLSFEVLG